MDNYCTPDRNARMAIAASEDTPSEVLEQLAQDEDADVRRRTASNPNTPPRILLSLGEEFPEEVIENPVFGLLLLEDFGSDSILLIFARSSTTSAQKLTELATTSSKKILTALAQNPNTPTSVLQQLFVRFRFTPNQDIYKAIAHNPNTPPELLDQFSNRLDLLADVARHPNTPASLLERLAAGDKNIRDLVRVHPNASTTALDIINFMEGKPETPAYILEKLVDHPSVDVRLRIAKHPNTSLSAFKKILNSCDRRSRWKIACHPYLSPLALETLVERLVDEHFQNPHLHQDYPSEFREALRAMRSYPNPTPKALKLLTYLPS